MAETQTAFPDDGIEEWRRLELARAGYPDDWAETLAMLPDVDLHEAVDLIHAGCPVHLAIRILT